MYSFVPFLPGQNPWLCPRDALQIWVPGRAVSNTFAVVGPGSGPRCHVSRARVHLLTHVPSWSHIFSTRNNTRGENLCDGNREKASKGSVQDLFHPIPSPFLLIQYYDTRSNGVKQPPLFFTALFIVFLLIRNLARFFAPRQSCHAVSRPPSSCSEQVQKIACAVALPPFVSFEEWRPITCSARPTCKLAMESRK